MGIFGKDKPAGDTQPDEGGALCGAEPGNAGADAAPAPGQTSTDRLDAQEWVTLKADHTHAGIHYAAGSRILVSPEHAADLRHFDVI